MKEIILWLINLEHTACEIYQQAAERFQENKQLSAFFNKMAEDEAWHYHAMASANEYINKTDLSIEPVIVIDEATESYQQIGFNNSNYNSSTFIDAVNNNPNYINNITGIAKEIGMAHITIRKYLKAMIDLDILSELSVGRNGKVFTLNKDSSTTRAFNDFIEILRSNVK